MRRRSYHNSCSPVLIHSREKARRADFEVQTQEGKYLGTGGEIFNKGGGFVVVKNEDEEKVMRVRTVMQVEDFPIRYEEEKRGKWTKLQDPEGRTFWMNEDTKQAMREVPMMCIEDNQEEEGADPKRRRIREKRRL